jgi:branched-subunit amino acid aminotransferase/4-amino-4-deoxychorismate lyase
MRSTAWLNGEFLPAAELALPVYDAGFVLGATVSEQLRTFGGRLFRLDEHLDRFDDGLRMLGIELPQTRGQLAEAAGELAARNHALMPPGGDLGLCLFATPGPYATLAGDAAVGGPMVAMHVYSLPFQLWRDKYERGQELVIGSLRQPPESSWPRSVKHRSRLHYYLADQEAARCRPGARALMLDAEGRVLETSTANILAHFPGRGLVSPPLEKILPGITLAATLELAARSGIATSFGDIFPQELRDANEIVMTSTPWCLLPVAAIEGVAVGNGRPGPIFRALLAAWNGLVGLDITEQARNACT